MALLGREAVVQESSEAVHLAHAAGPVVEVADAIAQSLHRVVRALVAAASPHEVGALQVALRHLRRQRHAVVVARIYVLPAQAHNSQPHDEISGE